MFTVIYLYARSLHGVRSKVNQNTKIKMANQNMQYVQGPKMDWTKDAGLHQQFKDWREEVELLMVTVLSHIRNANTKMKFVTLWAGKEARTYLSTLEEDHRDSLRAILDSLEDWTKPKSDEIAAFTHLRTLNQGNKMLSSYIQEVRRIVDLCKFACVGDCKDRLIRNSIMAGLSSTKAYQQCISKGSSLSLNESIRICQTEDATCRQVQALWPESKDCTDSTPIHQITQVPQVHHRTSFMGRGATGAHLEVGDLATGAAWEELTPRETTDTVPRLHVGTAAHGPTGQERCAKPQTRNFTIVGDSDTFQKYADKGQTIKIMKRLQLNTLTLKNSPQTTFRVNTPPHATSPMNKRQPQSNASRLQLESTKFKTDTEHIRPLWVAQSRGSQVFQTECEVDTGAGYNILPTHKAQQLFGQEWLGQLDKPKVHIEAYGGQSVHSLGSCILHLHIDNKAFPTIF